MNWLRLTAGFALLAAAAVALSLFWPFGHRQQVLHLPGVVEIQEIHLGSKIAGRVERVEAVEGMTAEPGQALVFFAMPEMEAQRQQWEAKLHAAEADYEKAKAGPRKEEIEAAQAAHESLQARLTMLKVGSRPEEIREARSQFESAEADLKLRRDEFDRIDRLFRQGSASRADYDAAKSARDSAQAQSAKAKARLDLLVAGSRIEEIQQADALARQAKANYDMLKAGTRKEDIDAAKARVDELRGKLNEIDANLQEAVVRAPERVVVEIVAVRKGDLVTPNQPVIRALRAQDLWVKVYVPETEMGKLQLNDKVQVTIDSYPGQTFEGTIRQIAAESEFTPRNVQSPDERRHQVFAARVYIDDPRGIFKSGMAAEVTVPLH
jgi:multidrug resistance efflux pump